MSPADGQDGPRTPRRDLRAPVLGLVSWGAALGALLTPAWVVATVAVAALAALVVRHRRGRAVAGLLTWWLAAAGVVVVTWVRVAAVQDDPVKRLAADRAQVSATVVVTSDPRVRPGRRGGFVVLRARTQWITGRGTRHRVRVPVLLLADRRWAQVRLGSRVRVSGALQPARTPDLAAVLSPRGPPRVLDEPGWLLTGAEGLRGSIRAAVADQPPGPRTLVPALVDGDDSGMPASLTAAFRTAGLTHLLAVSGTNLTIVVGALLALARRAGVRARGLTWVGALGVLGFVLLARAEPSVLRAAVMGSVALIGLGDRTRRRGMRAWGAAVLLLMMFDPWLATAPGFALSALATAGILVFAPGWRDRLARWLPAWVAEAIAVPLAAQLACTPLVAALSGQVSLVAVAANLAVAVVVAPATVLGLAGGVVGLVAEPVGRAVAAPAAWSAQWIISVAEYTAGLPGASVSWVPGPLGLALLVVLCLAAAAAAGRVLAGPGPALACTAVLVLAVLVPLPTPGWPPRGWVMVACDIGQGDGLVLNAGSGRAVVVDAGPDPGPMDRCLRRLGITQIPLVVLTHFHADHVDGLSGVVRGRRVGLLEVSGLAEPAAGARLVSAVAASRALPVRQAAYGETGSYGPLRWQVLAPSRATPPPGSQSPPNDSSVVLLVETRGLRLLLLAEEQEPSQARLWRELGGRLQVDVLKVAHHGSARQYPELVRGLGARLAVIPVGANNDYGHPAPSLLALLRAARMRIARTDQDGDVAVVAGPRGELRVATRR